MVTNNELDKLEALARAADQGEGQHVYTNWRDSNNWAANAAWHIAAEPATVLQLIELARRSTSGSDETQSVKVDELSDKLDRVSRWIDKFPVPTDGATAMMRHLREVKDALAQQATTARASDILPCPFCGKEAAREDVEHARDCFFAVSAHLDLDVKLCREAWNRRAPAPSRDAASDAPAAEEVRDAKDAARYRWLRDRDNNLDAVTDGDTMLFGESLDHTIDTEIAAMSASQGKTEEATTAKNAAVGFDGNLQKLHIACAAAPHDTLKGDKQ